MDKVLETKNKVVNTLVGGVAGLLRSYGVDVHKGIGTITKDKNVLVNGSELLETKKIILAGGSKVSKINVPGMESTLVMTSDDILEMNEVPDRTWSSLHDLWFKSNSHRNDGPYRSSYGCGSI